MNDHTPPAQNPVTRDEIIDAIEPAFDRRSATRDDLLAEAESNGARGAVTTVLSELPDDRHFPTVRDIWAHLNVAPDLH
ncbi:MAG: DUF2795 domain-containing protein [Rhodococcus sp. (in: high G+C Gram-positive bacteria)]|uniref:DUF2795 domain-containing protein n=1 Tax=Rhodococcus sp. TaxID=1831 RepID=UPI002ADCCBF4|nr:DUF2795 domain-containing protein [Rhodococcus sp. (in: high G+C Gram-positive bacteria)]